MKGATIGWIEDQKVPYAHKNNEWVGFDTKESYEHKVGMTVTLLLDYIVVPTVQYITFSVTKQNHTISSC